MAYQTDIIEAIFKASSGKHEQAGVQVYHNNFIENGIRALSISFPTVAFFVEEADFRALAREYLLAQPKTQFDWADYGESFADFIMAHPNLVELVFLSELAELDWLIAQVQRSEDKIFEGESFALLNEHSLDRLVFEPAPGFIIAKFFFPVSQLYQLANDAELAVEGPQRSAFMRTLNKSMSDAINLDTPRSILLWRPDYQAQILSLDDSETALFTQLQNAESIDHIFSHFADTPEQISIWLSEQIVQKRIYGVLLKN